MRRSRFTDEQIIAILAEHEAGFKTKDLCRKHGVSDATFYKWKAKFGGMTVSETSRLRTLEDENRRLKRLLVRPSSMPPARDALRGIRLIVENCAYEQSYDQCGQTT